MLRKVNFYSICFAFGLSVLLILAGSRYTDNINYHPSIESRRNIRNFLRVEDGDIVQPVYEPTVSFPYYDSMDNEKILNKTSFRIKYDLSTYNFSHSGVQKLEDLLMEAGGKPIRNIIISTWRSGTTFLGEVLNAMPGNFYHYEPLLKFQIVQIRGLPLSAEALSIIKNMLKCNFDGLDEYFEYGKKHLYQFSHNTRLWDHCKYKKELCFDAEFTGRFCKLFPFQSMKVVRVRLRLIQEILDEKELNVKVVLLIRDPRGVMQSRQHRDFCQPAADCWQPELLCADMISDYVAAGRLLKQYPDKLMVLRYEELALDPNKTTLNLLKFLRMGMTSSVEKFLSTHTNVEVAGVSSTFRISQHVPFRWKNVLDFDYVDNIQEVCKEAMDLWGYRLAHNSSHMTSKDFNPIMEYVVNQ
ncbi:carbohydrate sulfotransferase 4 [Plodia interpunctella]|uniref:carbohydrate sulfotransferase 4 n=1 Tax=Plodia interpunctella TaxID=58824 RepID=UPI00236763DB|nr:carbohydrate sulfotransferase 4 [Plodia interpunctella]